MPAQPVQSVWPSPLLSGTPFPPPLDPHSASTAMRSPGCHARATSQKACVKLEAAEGGLSAVCFPSLSAHSPAYGHFALRICVIGRTFCVCMCVCEAERWKQTCIC